jgi:hypothetical protein
MLVVSLMPPRSLNVRGEGWTHDDALTVAVAGLLGVAGKRGRLGGHAWRWWAAEGWKERQ